MNYDDAIARLGRKTLQRYRKGELEDPKICALIEHVRLNSPGAGEDCFWCHEPIDIGEGTNTEHGAAHRKCFETKRKRRTERRKQRLMIPVGDNQLRVRAHAVVRYLDRIENQPVQHYKNRHGLTSDMELLVWLEDQGKIDIEKLLRDVVPTDTARHIADSLFLEGKYAAGTHHVIVGDGGHVRTVLHNHQVHSVPSWTTLNQL